MGQKRELTLSLDEAFSDEEKKRHDAIVAQVVKLNEEIAERQGKRAELEQQLQEIRSKAAERIRAQIEELQRLAFDALGFVAPARSTTRTTGANRGRKLKIYIDGRLAQRDNQVPIEALRTLPGIPGSGSLTVFLDSVGLSFDEYRRGGWSVKYAGRLVEGRME